MHDHFLTSFGQRILTFQIRMLEKASLVCLSHIKSRLVPCILMNFLFPFSSPAKTNFKIDNILNASQSIHFHLNILESII